MSGAAAESETSPRASNNKAKRSPSRSVSWFFFFYFLSFLRRGPLRPVAAAGLKLALLCSLYTHTQRTDRVAHRTIGIKEKGRGRKREGDARVPAATGSFFGTKFLLAWCFFSSDFSCFFSRSGESCDLLLRVNTVRPMLEKYTCTCS